MKQYILDRLKEKSTWGSLLTIASSLFGVVFIPEQKEAIMTLGLALVGAIAVFTKADKKK